MRFHLDHPDPAAAFATDLDNPPPPSTIHSPAARGPRPPTSPDVPAAAGLPDVLDTVLGQSRPDIHLDLGLGQTGQVGDRLAHLVLNLIEAPHLGDCAHVGASSTHQSPRPRSAVTVNIRVIATTPF